MDSWMVPFYDHQFDEGIFENNELLEQHPETDVTNSMDTFIDNYKFQDSIEYVEEFVCDVDHNYCKKEHSINVNNQHVQRSFFKSDYDPCWGEGVKFDHTSNNISPVFFKGESPASEVIIESEQVYDKISDSSDNILVESTSINVLVAPKQNRGRPRVAPEMHLSMISHHTPKKEMKTLSNNAASCKYRHKKADQQALAVEILKKETKRNETLKRKEKKLADDIERLQLLLEPGSYTLPKTLPKYF